MKYTVLIRQPVPEDARLDLEQQLADRFGLSAEQAQRLASRRSGRLMKPTGRTRAELLLGVFEKAGAGVTLEEVREETGLLNEPFEGLGATRAGASAVFGAETSLSATPGLGDAASTSAEWPAALGGSVTASPAASGVMVPDDADTGSTSADWPAMDIGQPGGLGAAASSAGTATAVLTADPFAARPGTPAPRPAPVAAAPIAEVPEVTPAPADVSDVWSDFTGALTIHDSGPKPEDSAAPAVVLAADEPAAEAVASTRPRRSLAQQVTISSLVPLALATGITMALLGLLLPNLQQQLIRQNAQAVAAAVGTSIDVTNQAAVNSQLDSLLGNSSVGFVRVELPDGTGFFRSRNAAMDSTLQTTVANFLKDSPDGEVLRFNLSPAAAYKEQLQRLEDVGAGETPQAETLRQQIADPANSRVDRDNYVVSRLGVFSNDQGQRLASNESEENGTLLYRVAVGVSNAQGQANLRNTLLLIFGVSLLALALGALLAQRTARRLTAPIERLVKAADAISMGDLSQPVRAERNDEIGDLSQALERMRLSLEAAMERLRRRKRS